MAKQELDLIEFAAGEVADSTSSMYPRPLMHNGDIVEQPANLATLTAPYTERTQSFIVAAKDSPFFLYMSHTFPHIPLAASPRFRVNRSSDCTAIR